MLSFGLQSDGTFFYNTDFLGKEGRVESIEMLVDDLVTNIGGLKSVTIRLELSCNFIQYMNSKI